MQTILERHNAMVVTVKLDPHHKDKIKAIADKEERKSSDILRRAVRLYLQSLEVHEQAS